MNTLNSKSINKPAVWTLFALAAVAMLALPASSKSNPRKWKPGSGAPAAGDEYTNPKDGSVLVYIPEGDVILGNDSGEDDEKPSNKVHIAGFWLAKYETTNTQYRSFLSSSDGSDYPDPGFLEDPQYNKPNFPVLGVRFGAAGAYSTWAGLRLPTEAEWEYAASGGKQMKYPTSTGEINSSLANILGDKSKDLPVAVGSYPPNPYGIFDMAGNAWEWTSSAYMKYPYDPTDGREDPAKRGHRVMRGGSYHFGERYARTQQRHHFAKHLRLDFVGLRMAASTSQLK